MRATPVSRAREAREVARRVDGLLGSEYTTADGEVRPLRADDIMVVAPYNAQVRCLREHLPEVVFLQDPRGRVRVTSGDQEVCKCTPGRQRSKGTRKASTTS